MNYIFFGTPEFAAIILEKLIKAGFIPEAVVCNPDRPVGRNKIITAPPAKSLVIKHETWNISVLQPEKLDKSFKFQVSSFKPDLFIVAAYAKIIPEAILDIPRLGAIGVHPSFLPKYRGSSPIQTAILNGDEKTGITLFLMDEKIDHGLILKKSEIRISKSETYESLHDKLAELSGDLLIETLPKFIKGEINPLPQNETEATYTKKFKTEDGYVDPEKLKEALENGGAAAVEIKRKIRALNPEPGVYMFINGKRTKLLEADLDFEGKLLLKKIQIEGKKPQKV